MAQSMLNRLNISKKDTACQTGDFYEFFSMISKTKSVHLRWSPRINDYVLEFTFSNLKKYIMRRDEWLKFKNSIHLIDNVFK
jgi:hypothetical protein